MIMQNEFAIFHWGYNVVFIQHIINKSFIIQKGDKVITKSYNTSILNESL